VELINNGSEVALNGMNKIQYIAQLSNFKLNVCIGPQLHYFLKGLYSMIPQRWLNIFNAYELQMLISGGGTRIDLEDLKKNIKLSWYHDSDPTILALWEVLEEFSEEERSRFIKFVTSVPRAPLLGFQELNPKFGIGFGGSDVSRLPTASTCVNLLKLPNYRNKRVLREKLLFAINSNSGFNLS
ncbi:HECT-type E3 ubiquitin-protein ligase ASCRUDRAFT_26056, partial [Ascoidea rubescens DSM 1968]